MRKVDNTKAPVVTDGFVGVCCKSMMKLCQAIKLSMLQPAKQADNQARDTRFDGKVVSQLAAMGHLRRSSIFGGGGSRSVSGRRHTTRIHDGQN
jgi:hypothetical protein